MKRSLGIIFLAVAVVASLPVVAGAQSTTPIDCGEGDGRERLTTAGFKLDFEAPFAKTYELTATLNQTRPYGTQREAKFPFTADFAPYSSGKVKAVLNWTGKGDHAVFIRDADGTDLGAGSAAQVFDGPETAEAELTQCQHFSIVARTGPGQPDSMMSLDVTVTPGATTLKCAEADPAPGCAGKAAGEAPELVPDGRTRLYLGGDRPGQLAMVFPYANPASATRGRLETSRPLGGTPNTFTRPVTGNPDFGEYTPFFPTWGHQFDKPTMVKGPIHAVVWVSSATMDDDDKLWFNLFLDGGQVERIEVLGSRIGTAATAVPVTFSKFDAGEVQSVSLQIVSPRANDDPPNQASYAEWTAFYDSVQFPSRVTLSLPAADPH